MTIENFGPNADGSAIILTLSDAVNADTLKIWNDSTYKDYGVAIDLSNKLTGDASQTITISTDDLSENFLKGAYFVQVEDNNTLAEAITGYTVSYEECILNKLINIGLCDDCLTKESLSLINAQALLTGLNYAIKQGFIEEAKNIRIALDKFCSNTCKTCGKYSHIKNNDYYDYNAE